MRHGPLQRTLVKRVSSSEGVKQHAGKMCIMKKCVGIFVGIQAHIVQVTTTLRKEYQR